MKKFLCPIPIPMFTAVNFGLFFTVYVFVVLFLIDVTAIKRHGMTCLVRTSRHDIGTLTITIMIT